MPEIVEAFNFKEGGQYLIEIKNTPGLSMHAAEELGNTINSMFHCKVIIVFTDGKGSTIKISKSPEDKENKSNVAE